MIHTKQYEWVIIFLIYADLRSEQNFREKQSKTERELESLYNDIRKANLNDAFKIYIIRNIIRENATDEKYDVTELIEVQPSKIETNGNVLKTITTYSTEFLVQKPAELGSIFNKIYKENRSNKYLLFTWDHGKAYGIFEFKNLNHEEEILQLKNSPYNRWWDSSIKSNRSHFKFLIKHSIDEPIVEEFLTNEELSIAIKYGFEGNRLDVLIMMNCGMQNVDTQYALKDAVKYLVAPQGTIDEPGYNYKKILEGIFSNSFISPKNIAKTAIESLDQDREFQQEDFKDVISRWAVFATDIEYFNLIIPIINLISKSLIEELNKQPDRRLLDDIFNSWRSCFRFDNDPRGSKGVTYILDMLNWLNTIITNIKLIELIDYKNQLEEITKFFVVEKYIGSNVYKMPEEDSFEGNLPPCGLAISYPPFYPDIPDMLALFLRSDSPYQSKFIKETLWIDYLKLLR